MINVYFWCYWFVWIIILNFDQVGDKVGVGCIVDSCMNCDCCKAGDEHFCEGGMTMTYANDIKHGHISTDSGYTYGGYCGSQTVNQRFTRTLYYLYTCKKSIQ